MDRFPKSTRWKSLTRYGLFLLGLTWNPLGLYARGVQSSTEQPNIVIIFCDDLGYGDLGCYGHPTIATPNLDRMAAEGQKWTQFYVGASVCTPSRAALMTGRLPIRSGLCGNRRVLFPDSAGGIPASEITIAEALRDLGYETGMVGKWHLGHLEQYLPTNHGFDSYYGIPYSNDMDRTESGPEGRAAFLEPQSAYWNVPLLRDTEIIERPTDQTTITRRYTDKAVQFIESHSKGQPFFLYLAHSMPHVPLFRSEDFEGRSRRGLFGDVIEEIDHSVGCLLDAIRNAGIEQETVVFFTSDNGPWLTFREQGGSAGLLRNGKGTTWEGGMREPFLAWWPGTIPSGTVVADLGTTMDLFVTSIKLAGGEVPSDRTLDGVDIRPALFGTGESPRNEVFYYRTTELYAVRSGPYKAHFITEDSYTRHNNKTRHETPVLYNVEFDPSETTDIAVDHPKVLEKLKGIAQEHQAKVQVVESLLQKRITLSSTSQADSLKSLQGKWESSTGLTGEVKITLEITGDRYTKTVETGPLSTFTYNGRVEINDQTVPHHLNWTETTAPDGAKVADAQGIFRLNNETLVICSGRPGGDRPKVFETTARRYPDYLQFNRVDASIPDLEGDLRTLQGKWTGKVGAQGITATLLIQNDKAEFLLTSSSGRQLSNSNGRIELDDSTDPKAMDWVNDENGRRLLSIYEIEGDQLRLCLSLGRGEPKRPEAFTASFPTFTLQRDSEGNPPDGR